MPANAAAENALGTIGAICWTVQLIPQIWKSWREKSTEGLSHYLVLLWGTASAFLGVYNIVQNLNVPLIVQPQLFGILSLVSWGQCLYYGNKWSLARSAALAISTVVILGGFETGMVFAVRPSYNRGNDRPVDVFGIISTVLIAAGLFPQYYEIYRHREVIGISILFMVIDLSGGLFSTLSLVFKSHFDIVAGITYSLVILLDGIVIVLALILNPLAARRRRRAAQAVADSSNGASASDSLARTRDDPSTGADEATIVPRPYDNASEGLEKAYGDGRREMPREVA
ncbi:PQ loop repeat-domain-containing protein [Amylocystis lapponica]|nr:PQ loop repeat-domain-containing protein [Amylocystis lapponica]